MVLPAGGLHPKIPANTGAVCGQGRAWWPQEGWGGWVDLDGTHLCYLPLHSPRQMAQTQPNTMCCV